MKFRIFPGFLTRVKIFWQGWKLAWKAKRRVKDAYSDPTAAVDSVDLQQVVMHDTTLWVQGLLPPETTEYKTMVDRLIASPGVGVEDLRKMISALEALKSSHLQPVPQMAANPSFRLWQVAIGETIQKEISRLGIRVEQLEAFGRV